MSLGTWCICDNSKNTLHSCLMVYKCFCTRIYWTLTDHPVEWVWYDGVLCYSYFTREEIESQKVCRIQLRVNRESLSELELEASFVTAMPKTKCAEQVFPPLHSPLWHHLSISFLFRTRSLRIYVYDAFQNKLGTEDKIPAVVLVWDVSSLLPASRAVLPHHSRQRSFQIAGQPCSGQCKDSLLPGSALTFTIIVTSFSFLSCQQGQWLHLSGSKLCDETICRRHFENCNISIQTKALYDLPGLCKSALLVDNHTGTLRI